MIRFPKKSMQIALLLPLVLFCMMLLPPRSAQAANDGPPPECGALVYDRISSVINHPFGVGQCVTLQSKDGDVYITFLSARTVGSSAYQVKVLASRGAVRRVYLLYMPADDSNGDTSYSAVLDVSATFPGTAATRLYFYPTEIATRRGEGIPGQ